MKGSTHMGSKQKKKNPVYLKRKETTACLSVQVFPLCTLLMDMYVSLT